MPANRKKPVVKNKGRFAPPIKRFNVSWRGPARVAGGVIAAAAVVAAVVAMLDRPIRHIVVDAPFQRVTAVQIEAAAAPLLKTGFLTVDLDALRDALAAMAWVDGVKVRRQWPDAVRLVVTEQVPAARWGEAGLLNTRGELFLAEARHVPPELPRLAGPEGTEWQVAQRYLDARAALLPRGLTPVALTLNERGAWRLELDTGLTVWLGREQADARMARFIDTVVPLLLSTAGTAKSVDMRYANGFAVHWRPSADSAVDTTLGNVRQRLRDDRGDERGDETDA